MRSIWPVMTTGAAPSPGLERQLEVELLVERLADRLLTSPVQKLSRRVATRRW